MRDQDAEAAIADFICDLEAKLSSISLECFEKCEELFENDGKKIRAALVLAAVGSSFFDSRAHKIIQGLENPLEGIMEYSALKMSSLKLDIGGRPDPSWFKGKHEEVRKELLGKRYFVVEIIDPETVGLFSVREDGLPEPPHGLKSKEESRALSKELGIDNKGDLGRAIFVAASSMLSLGIEPKARRRKMMEPLARKVFLEQQEKKEPLTIYLQEAVLRAVAELEAGA